MIKKLIETATSALQDITDGFNICWHGVLLVNNDKSTFKVVQPMRVSDDFGDGRLTPCAPHGLGGHVDICLKGWVGMEDFLGILSVRRTHTYTQVNKISLPHLMGHTSPLQLGFWPVWRFFRAFQVGEIIPFPTPTLKRILTSYPPQRKPTSILRPHTTLIAFPSLPRPFFFIRGGYRFYRRLSQLIRLINRQSTEFVGYDKLYFRKYRLTFD
jgi:hypothetical protein